MLVRKDSVSIHIGTLMTQFPPTWLRTRVAFPPLRDFYWWYSLLLTIHNVRNCCFVLFPLAANPSNWQSLLFQEIHCWRYIPNVSHEAIYEACRFRRGTAFILLNTVCPGLSFRLKNLSQINSMMGLSYITLFLHHCFSQNPTHLVTLINKWYRH